MRALIAVGIVLLVFAQAQPGRGQPVAAHQAFLPLVRRTGLSFGSTATPTSTATQPAPACDPSYPDVCIPPPPPDLDCTRIIYRNFTVLPPDPHGFDGDGDGLGCEDPATNTPTSTATQTATRTPTWTPTATRIPDQTITYRVEGAATQATVSYIDANGSDQELVVSLPWVYQFTAPPDADLAVEAFTQEAGSLNCTIRINGSAVVFDQTDNGANGVVCERFIN
jgi:hypothetical protein